MINPYTTLLLVFTALAGCFPVEAMESPDAPPVVWRDFSDFKHEWAALEEEEEEDRHILNEVLAWQQESQSSDSDGEDDLEEAIRLSLEASNAPQSDSENDPAVQEAILRSRLEISSVRPLFGMEQETPASTPNTPAFKNEEKSIEDSWWLINSKVNEDPLLEETRKQQEWKEEKEALAREIVGFYPQIRKLYEDYRKTQAEALKILNESNGYPYDSEEKKSADKKYNELFSRKYDIYRDFESQKREEDRKIESYLSLLSGEERELFGKKMEDFRRLLEELRKEVDQKDQEKGAAHDAYMNVACANAREDEEEKNRLRQNWFDLDDQYDVLRIKLDEALINESQMIHEYFCGLIHGFGDEYGARENEIPESFGSIMGMASEEKKELLDRILAFYPQISDLVRLYHRGAALDALIEGNQKQISLIESYMSSLPLALNGEKEFLRRELDEFLFRITPLQEEVRKIRDEGNAEYDAIEKRQRTQLTLIQAIIDENTLLYDHFSSTYRMLFLFSGHEDDDAAQYSWPLSHRGKREQPETSSSSTLGSWHLIEGAEISQVENGKQEEERAERKKKKRSMREDILDLSLKIKDMYEEYTKPIHWELDEHIQEKEREEKAAVYLKLNQFTQEQNDMVEAYLPLASVKVRESLTQELDDHRKEIKNLREEINKKDKEERAASKEYFGMKDVEWNDPKKEEARNKWYALMDERRNLSSTLEEATVQESKAIYDYFVKRAFMKWPKRKMA